VDEIDAARPVLLGETERALAEGQTTEWLHLVFLLINLETRAGNWELAAQYCAEALPEARDVGISYVIQNLEVAYLGLKSLCGENGARAGLIEAVERGWQSGHVQASQTALFYLSWFDEAKSDAAGAWHWISSLFEFRRKAAVSSPAPGPSTPRVFLDRILAAESLLALGESERAAGYVDELVQISEHTGQPMALVAAARSRALLEASRGDCEAASEAFEQALEAHAGLANPFELARTELFYGMTLRRAKRRGEAREMISRAFKRFEALGAAEWLARARGELARTGAGPRTSGDELTPTERRVAELVATGRSNKEVAAALSMSVRTVEAHLSKIFRKLELESRLELASRLQADER
jgi:DNA-binding CsgD family transcriptional regulator